MRHPLIFLGFLGASVLGAAVIAFSNALHAANDTFPPGGDPVTAALRAQLATLTAVCGGAYLDTARLASFYVIDRAVPLWVTDAGPGARAERLREALDSAGQEGLAPANYRLGEIERHWQARMPAAKACLDLLLTDAFRRYASDVHSGRIDPREADPAWYPRPAPFEPAEALRAASSEHAFAAFLHDLPPPHTGYQRLREALARYEALARDGGWTNVAAGASIEPGMSDVRVPVLRARLRAEGDLRGITFGGERYDERLAAAVRQFQKRHGLTADGIVGSRTRAAMNVPVAERLAQMRRTMERWRWLPRSLGDPHVLVNTAGFELDVVDGQRSVLEMRVIVGTPDQATPSFTASMDALVINPYWNVPLRIARDKLLPIQQRNPRFFVSRGFRVYSNGGVSSREIDPAGIDWWRVSTEEFPYRLRQEPGEKNSMGRVAFVLPNPFDIFLHDTPERRLFERETRTFSEGCVRIERFMPLALYALRGSEGWDEGHIRAEIESLRHQKVALSRPIPVHVLYLTSWIDDAGVAHFVGDAYQREKVLARYYPATQAP